MNYQDYRQKLNQKLNDKVQQELSSFQEEMLSRSPQAARALMKSPNLLQEVYEEWLETDYSHMEDLNRTVTVFKNYMVKTEKILSEKER